MSHHEVQGLLPWYVNATLDEAERRAVEDHLPSCVECAREAAQLRDLQAAFVEAEEAALGPSPSALVRARAAIDRPLRGWWASLPVFARVALVAQVLIIAVLSALLLARGPREEPFRTVAGPSTAGATIRATIVLAFAEGVSEASLRRTIAGIDGTIVAGPSAAGLYTVELPLAPERDDEIEAVLRRLRADRALVRLAARRY